MATDRQIQANRQNAQKSSGPRTPAGKLASSANSTRHGIHIADATLVQDPESADDLQQAFDDYLNYYQPESPAEVDTVHELAVCRIHACRLQRIGAGLLNVSREEVIAEEVYTGPNGQTIHRYELSNYPPEEQRTVAGMLLSAAWIRIESSMEAISRQEARIATRRRRALRDLRELRQDRITGPEPDLEPAPVPAPAPPPDPEPAPPPEPAAGKASEPVQKTVLRNEPNFAEPHSKPVASDHNQAKPGGGIHHVPPTDKEVA